MFGTPGEFLALRQLGLGSRTSISDPMAGQEETELRVVRVDTACRGVFLAIPPSPRSIPLSALLRPGGLPLFPEGEIGIKELKPIKGKISREEAGEESKRREQGGD